MIQLWVVLAGIAVVFLLASVWLLARALFAAKVLQWARHRKTSIGSEALWVWRIALLLVLAIGIGEFLRIGNPLLSADYGTKSAIGILLLCLGLLCWLAAMNARRQYLWFLQVLAPKEELPAYSTRGIYGIVRNPRELGFVLVLAGLSLALALKFAPVFVVLFLFATMYRVSSRDRIMMEKYGQAYVTYSRSCKKLIPGIW